MVFRDRVSVDVGACLEKGFVGAIGAVPGTVCAHPFDVVKIRMQTTPGVGGLRAAVMAVGGETKPRVGRFFAGLSPAVMQKVLTRGPMFLASEFSTQVVESTTQLGRTGSCFVGSFCSGFMTGNLAALPEYHKVLRSQNLAGQGADSISGLVRTALANKRGVSLLRRMRFAGTRNGIFDSCFFGTQHLLSGSMSSGQSYACAAVSAVVLDYSVDVAVKRSMALPPHLGVNSLRSCLHRLFSGHRSLSHGLLAVYAGLTPKCLEFSVSYFVTGTVGVATAASLKAVFWG